MTIIALLLMLVYSAYSTAYTEAVSASLSAGDGKKMPYTPQVAFKCGFRNRYMTEQGEWKTDPDARASCLTGKLDVLKYCRRVYRKLKVTNIVENTHFVEIDNWCKVEGTPCKWSFWTKPYRCIVGEFESETLLVPKGCHFDHVNRDSLCKDFDYWNRTAVTRCSRRGDNHQVHSFAMLEPCGVDMFSGVELVCCPQSAAGGGDKSTDQVHIDTIKVNVKPESEQDSEHDLFASSQARATSRRPLVGTSVEVEDGKRTASPDAKKNLFTLKADDLDDEDEDDDDDDDNDDDLDDGDESDDEDDTAASDSKSLYLRVADPKNEHEAYRNALNDLNKQHHEKVSKVMKEWSELEERFIKMKAKDPVHADKFKAEMNSRFQKTVAALEEENAEERSQVEHIHQQRIVANLNEKKRHALMEFHKLYSQRQDPEPRTVLHALKAYVRAEEKERLHLINHYRHLLHSRIADALASEVDLLGKLLEIDRRIGSTFDMLTSHPLIDGKVKLAITDFFNVYRRENTPDLPDNFPDGFLNADQYRDLMEVYRRQVAPEAQSVTPSVIEHSTGRRWTDRVEVVKEEPEEQHYVTAEMFEQQPRMDVMEQYSSLNKKHRLSQDFTFKEESLSGVSRAAGSSGYILLTIAGVCVVGAVMCALFIFRHRSSRASQGFIEVSACTPEECHVANMQITGYENPAYKYFEERS